jgi:hypothetical protein
MRDVVQTLPADEVREAAPLADATPEEAADQRYFQALLQLTTDAEEHNRVELLADQLAFAVARIAALHGLGAAGDLIRRIGYYLQDLNARRLAAEQAEAARKEGHLPH